MKRTPRADMIRKAETIAHLYVCTWSPGDDITRYRFFDTWVDDYHAGNPLHTALGLAQANTYLRGYIDGLRRYRK